MEIKQYAPVVIPTLNRYDHFKACLESLEKCRGVDKTDVYVVLDFSPSEEYYVK
jgi:glycosyltransferase involved in cell wall biosynthesis